MSELKAQEITVAAGERALVPGLSLTVRAGECWAVLGRNGTGKTSLLHTLAGLRRPRQGTVWLAGRRLASHSRRMLSRRLGLLLQDSADTFPASVRETAMLGRHPHIPPWGRESAADHAIADAALAEVALEALADRDVQTLSGGERRRLDLAVLLAQRPEIFLLDEPTSHLDLHHQFDLLGLFRNLAESGAGVIMAVHELHHAARFCDHALLLFGDGSSVAGPIEEVLTIERLTTAFGHPVRRYELDDGPIFLPAATR